MEPVAKPEIVGGVVYNADEAVCGWMATRMDEPFERREDTRALGVWRDGRLVAGVAFDAWNGCNVIASIASDGPRSRWATRPVLGRLFAYPFIQADHNRITTTVRADNVLSHKATIAMGFTPEGCLVGAAHDGQDLIVYRMFRSECPWLDGWEG